VLALLTHPSLPLSLSLALSVEVTAKTHVGLFSTRQHLYFTKQSKEREQNREWINNRRTRRALELVMIFVTNGGLLGYSKFSQTAQYTWLNMLLIHRIQLGKGFRQVKKHTKKYTWAFLLCSNFSKTEIKWQCCIWVFLGMIWWKVRVHPKIKIISSWTRHHVVPNLYYFPLWRIK